MQGRHDVVQPRALDGCEPVFLTAVSVALCCSVAAQLQLVLMQPMLRLFGERGTLAIGLVAWMARARLPLLHLFRCVLHCVTACVCRGLSGKLCCGAGCR